MVSTSLLSTFLVFGLSFHAEGRRSGNGLSSALSSLKDNLFSMKCKANEERLYSDWSICVWPQGDLRKLVTSFVSDSRDKGCKMPPRKMIGYALKTLKKSSYKKHPLYKRIPKQECGYCGRRAQCCRKSRSFLTQSFRSDYCSETSPPCQIDPVDATFKAELEAHFPGSEVELGTCDVTELIDKEIVRLHNDQAFKYIKPLFCQIIGTTKPSVTCQK